MCGIAGIISPNPDLVSFTRLKKMADVLSHRGPDGEGYWINSNQSVGFAHRRLSVIDLTDAAAQPMHYDTGAATDFPQRYTITYNGQLYNYPEIRTYLISKGYHFRTQSDTEVVLAAYDYYKEACLEYFDGMFAFALWDEKSQTLFAARDRFGEKPFFYFFDDANRTLLFASEMKAIWAAGIEKRVDGEALLNYVGLGITRFPIENQRTFYRNIFSLSPAHYLKWQPGRTMIAVQRYWDIDKHQRSRYSDKEAVEMFSSLFTTSVNRRLRSDVPVGASLSGGLDSSSIAATIHHLFPAHRDYKNYSVVFPGHENDESQYMRQVITAFSLNHYHISPNHYCLVDQLEKMCYHHEQPIGSASVFIQYYVSQLAGRHGTKVLLDGQGADETMGGYTKYIHWWLQELLRQGKISQFTKAKRQLTVNQIPYNWNYQNYMAAFVPGLTALMLQRRENKKLQTNKEIHPDFLDAFGESGGLYKPMINGLNDALYFNTMQFGLEELLSYGDRNSMSEGIELRLPFLSHDLVSFLFSLSGNYKIRNGYTKWILREAMKNDLPPEITWRKDKIGFEPPQQQWMSEPAVQECIYNARRKLAEAGILRREVVQMPARPVSAYAADNRDWRYLIAATLLVQT